MFIVLTLLLLVQVNAFVPVFRTPLNSYKHCQVLSETFTPDTVNGADFTVSSSTCDISGNNSPCTEVSVSTAQSSLATVSNEGYEFVFSAGDSIEASLFESDTAATIALDILVDDCSQEDCAITRAVSLALLVQSNGEWYETPNVPITRSTWATLSFDFSKDLRGFKRSCYSYLQGRCFENEAACTAANGEASLSFDDPFAVSYTHLTLPTIYSV